MNSEAALRQQAAQQCAVWTSFDQQHVLTVLTDALATHARFAFPDPDQEAGLPVASCLLVKAPLQVGGGGAVAQRAAQRSAEGAQRSAAQKEQV